MMDFETGTIRLSAAFNLDKEQKIVGKFVLKIVLKEPDRSIDNRNGGKSPLLQKGKANIFTTACTIPKKLLG